MLGRIYTNKKTFKSIQFIDVNPIGHYFEDENIPTLLIGKKDIDGLGYKLSFLNKEIKKNLFWTYSKTERRNEYEIDVLNFYKFIFSTVYKNIKYANICIYTMGFSKFKKLLNLINDNSIKKVIYIKHNHIYIYFDNVVYGISLSEIKYCGINENKVIDLLISGKNCNIITNDNFIKNDIKVFLSNRDYLIPYFHSILVEN